MPNQPLRVLIWGASVAGPTAAYWLCRQGFAVTVIERMPLTRVRGSGHSVDLPAVTEARTRTKIVSFHVPKAEASTSRCAGISGRHVEIRRGELAAILYDATQKGVQYVRRLDRHHGPRNLTAGIVVTFEHAPPDQFDLVIGADGLHSTVRRLTFGPEDEFRRILGGYLPGAALPHRFGLGGRMVVSTAPVDSPPSTPFTAPRRPIRVPVPPQRETHDRPP